MKETIYELSDITIRKTVYWISGQPYEEFMRWEKTETGYRITAGYRPMKIVKTKRLKKGEELTIPWLN